MKEIKIALGDSTSLFVFMRQLKEIPSWQSLFGIRCDENNTVTIEFWDSRVQAAFWLLVSGFNHQKRGAK